MNLYCLNSFVLHFLAFSLFGIKLHICIWRSAEIRICFETLYNFFVYHLEVIRYSDSYSALGPTMVQILEMELNWSVVSKQSHKYIIIATFIVFPQPQHISTWFMIWVGGKITTLLMGIYKFYSCFKGEERLEEIADCCCYELGKDYGYNEILHFDDIRIESIICIIQSTP